MFSAFKSIVRSARSKFTKKSRSVSNLPIAIMVSVSEESLVDGVDASGPQASTETVMTLDLNDQVQVPEFDSSATDGDSDENDEYETYIFNPAPPAIITYNCDSDCDISIASDYGTVIRHRPYDAPWNDRVTCPREADCECCSFGDIDSEYGGEWYNYSEWEVAMEHGASVECDDELMRMFECHDYECDDEDVFECETHEDGEAEVKDIHATRGVSIQFNWSDYQGCAAVVECEDELASAFEYKSECEGDDEDSCFGYEALERADMELVKDVNVTSGIEGRFNWSGRQECVVVVEHGDESMSMFRYESERGGESESENDWLDSEMEEVELMSHDECSAMFEGCFEDGASAVPEMGFQYTWLDHVEYGTVQYELEYESGSEIDEEDERHECERKADDELAVTVFRKDGFGNGMCFVTTLMTGQKDEEFDWEFNQECECVFECECGRESSDESGSSGDSEDDDATDALTAFTRWRQHSEEDLNSDKIVALSPQCFPAVCPPAGVVTFWKDGEMVYAPALLTYISEWVDKELRFEPLLWT